MADAEIEVETYFLPALRSDAAELRRQVETVASSEAPLLFDQHPEFTLILNSSRQILYANRAARAMISTHDWYPIGLRLGEALGCVHVCEGPGGCGTGSFCRLCGAADTLAHGIAGMAYTGECMLRRRRVDDQGERDEALDLLVWSSPLKFHGLDLLLLSARDISTLKRHEVLERVFYHDIANTAMGIQSLLGLLPTGQPETDHGYLGLLRAAAGQLGEEIASHRALKAAEDDALIVQPFFVDALRVLEEAVAFFAYHLYGKQVSCAIDPASERLQIQTDPTILRRILVNMTKNALEAAEEGEVIGLALGRRGESAVFTVRNRAVIPADARKRVFERSFSTKGPGRGVGTYGMRLLGERYLRGSVDFSSNEGMGTEFRLSLPLQFPSSLPGGAAS